MTNPTLSALPALAVIALCVPVAARADIPAPVRDMIDAAIATGDETKVRIVIDLARTTNPDDTGELDAIFASFETDLAEAKAAEETAKLAEIRNAGLLDNWSGKGELGAFRATGNSSNTGITAGLNLNREGINWRHRVTGRVDYQRANGVTTREQFLVRYEPNYNISDDFYAYALAQYERDRFQGFSDRYAVSGGIGYKVLNEEGLNLSFKAGPAYRVTEFLDGRSESRIAGLIGADFDWDITDKLKLTHDTNAVAEAGGAAIAIIDSSNTSIDFVTGLNAQINSSLAARFSYAIEYDSNPPPGAVQTDTLSRVTLIYDF